MRMAPLGMLAICLALAACANWTPRQATLVAGLSGPDENILLLQQRVSRQFPLAAPARALEAELRRQGFTVRSPRSAYGVATLGFGGGAQWTRSRRNLES